MGNLCSNNVGENEKVVFIINNTDKTICLRDREREMYGILRHKIEPRGKLRLKVDLRDAGTYYQMAVLIMLNSSTDNNKLEPTFPALFIDTEDLHHQKEITIHDGKSGEVILHKKLRT